jgi:hypothetical protein
MNRKFAPNNKVTNTMIDERNFLLEKVARIQELRRQCTDQETYSVEVAKLLAATASNEAERRTWEELLKTGKFFQRLSQDDEREDIIKQVRAALKTRCPFIPFLVMRTGARSTRRWVICWSNGPLEAEIKKIVAPFVRRDLTFSYFRKSAPHQTGAS